MRTRVLLSIVLVSCLASSRPVLAQTRTPPTPTISIDSLVGGDSFELYCASCHGADGRGNGPVAKELRTKPADLTTLSQRNSGIFPRDDIRAVVSGQGRALSAHGPSEMPVWGPMFRLFESDARVRERIENLVTHVESMQRPSTGVNDPGATAFRTYCASCHGADGRGGGPAAGQLRHVPPDLTKFTTRNGGVFPAVRLSNIIDGRDVAAHGDREMPVWGDAFMASPGRLTPQQVKERIDAIVKFLASIQERPAE